MVVDGDDAKTSRVMSDLVATNWVHDLSLDIDDVFLDRVLVVTEPVPYQVAVSGAVTANDDGVASFFQPRQEEASVGANAFEESRLVVAETEDQESSSHPLSWLQEMDVVLASWMNRKRLRAATDHVADECELHRGG